MSAPAALSGLPRPSLRAAKAGKSRREPLRAGAVVEVMQDGPSMAGRLAWLGARLMIRPTLSVGSCLPSAPWPWGVVEFGARAITPTPGTVRAGVELAHCTAQLVRAAGVLPADGTRRVVLYLHGGAFLTCGPYSHGRLVSMLSGFADSPILVPNYRKIPETFHPRGDRRLLRRLPVVAPKRLSAQPDRACRRFGRRLSGASAGPTPARVR